MSVVTVRVASLSSRIWVSMAAILSVPILSLCLSQVGVTTAMAIVAALIGIVVALALIASQQFAVVAAMCIGVAVFFDWFPLLPYPFGGPGIPLAPILALGLFGYIILTTAPAASAIWPKRLWIWIPLLLLAAPAILAGQSFQESVNYYGAVFVAPLVFLVLGTVVAQNEGQFRLLLQCLAGLAALIAIHALIQAFTGVFLFETPYIQKFLETYEDFTFSGTNVSRFGSFLLNPDTTGAFFALSAFLPLGLFVSTHSRRARALYSIEISLIFAALLETYAVGPMLAFGAGMLCFVIMTMRGSRGIQVTLLVCLLATVLYFVFPSQVRVLIIHATEPTEVGLRIAIWRTAINMIKTFPVTGIGLGSGNYKALENLFRVPEQNVFEPEPHNTYLEVAVYAGIFTAIVFIFLVASAVKDAITSVLAAPERFRALLAVVPAVCIALSVHSFENSGWTCRPLEWMAWLLVGAAASPLLMNSLRKSALLAPDERKPRDERANHNDTNPSLRWRRRQRLHANTVQTESKPVHLSQEEAPESRWSVSPHPNDAFAAPPGIADEISEPLDFDMMSTAIMPYVSLPEVEPWQVTTAIHASIAMPQQRSTAAPGATPLARLLKDSGVYAIASLVSPFISLALAPFVTRNLSLADYGTLTLINSAMALTQFLTQLGLGPAIVRAYNYEFTNERDRRNLLGAAQVVVVVVSTAMLAIVALSAHFLAGALLQRPLLASALVAAAVSLFLQNLTLPGMAWLLATSRRLTYTLLTILGSVATLGATVVVVGWLQLGIPGVIIAGAIANLIVLVSLLPVALTQTGWHIRLNMVRSLVLVGLPTIPAFVTGWVLQLADRYILSLFVQSASVAVYAIGYTMGWILTSLIVSPFVSAWGTRMFAIAKLENAQDIFRQVFRLYSLVLLFAAFGLATFAPLVLGLLFPEPYQTAAPIITIVAAASVCNGIYYVFHVGCQITRKLWLLPVYFAASATVNVLLNLLLIPRFGILGAAFATLLGYSTLALLAYVGNRIIYPTPFEIGRFLVAALIGVVLYVEVSRTLSTLQAPWALALRSLAILFYGLCLLIASGEFSTRVRLGSWRGAFQTSLRRL